MIRYNRLIEDEDEEQLLYTGWVMVGISLWRHPLFGRTKFTKQSAIAADVSSYQFIEREHTTMLNMLYRISNLPKNEATSIWSVINLADGVASKIEYI